MSTPARSLGTVNKYKFGSRKCEEQHGIRKFVCPMKRPELMGACFESTNCSWRCYANIIGRATSRLRRSEKIARAPR